MRMARILIVSGIPREAIVRAMGMVTNMPTKTQIKLAVLAAEEPLVVAMTLVLAIPTRSWLNSRPRLLNRNQRRFLSKPRSSGRRLQTDRPAARHIQLLQKRLVVSSETSRT